MRLCRPMCGKAAPFRLLLLFDYRGYAANGEAQPHQIKKLDGKAEPFRISGGRAAEN